MMNKIKNIKRYSVVLCLASALTFAPVCSANAKSYHRGDSLVAAAVGGAVIGLVGAVVHNVLNANPAVVIEEPVYIAPAPVIVRPSHHYRAMHPARYVRHHYRHH